MEAGISLASLEGFNPKPSKTTLDLRGGLEERD